MNELLSALRGMLIVSSSVYLPLADPGCVGGAFHGTEYSTNLI